MHEWKRGYDIQLLRDIGLAEPGTVKLRDNALLAEFENFCAGLTRTSDSNAILCDENYFFTSVGKENSTSRMKLLAVFLNAGDIRVEIKRRIEDYLAVCSRCLGGMTSDLLSEKEALNKPDGVLTTYRLSRSKLCLVGTASVPLEKVMLDIVGYGGPGNSWQTSLKSTTFTSEWDIVSVWWQSSTYMTEHCLPGLVGFIPVSRRAAGLASILSLTPFGSGNELSISGLDDWEAELVELNWRKDPEEYDESAQFGCELLSFSNEVLKDMYRKYGSLRAEEVERILTERLEDRECKEREIQTSEDELRMFSIQPRSPKEFPNVTVDQLSKEERIAIERWLGLLFPDKSPKVVWRQSARTGEGFCPSGMFSGMRPATVFEISWKDYAKGVKSVKFFEKPYPSVTDAFDVALRGIGKTPKFSD